MIICQYIQNNLNIEKIINKESCMKKLILILTLLFSTIEFQAHAELFPEQECHFIGVSLLTRDRGVKNFFDDTNGIKKIETNDLGKAYSIFLNDIDYVYTNKYNSNRIKKFYHNFLTHLPKSDKIINIDMKTVLSDNIKVKYEFSENSVLINIMINNRIFGYMSFAKRNNIIYFEKNMYDIEELLLNDDYLYPKVSVGNIFNWVKIPCYILTNKISCVDNNKNIEYKSNILIDVGGDRCDGFYKTKIRTNSIKKAYELYYKSSTTDILLNTLPKNSTSYELSDDMSGTFFIKYIVEKDTALVYVNSENFGSELVIFKQYKDYVEVISFNGYNFINLDNHQLIKIKNNALKYDELFENAINDILQ